MFIQSFYSIDIMSNVLFNIVDVGSTKLLYVSQKSHKNPGGDYYVTNLQYRSINKNFEKMLQAISFTENDIILIAGENYLEGNKNYSLAELNGRHNSIKWDPEANSYTNRYDVNIPAIRIMTTNELWGRSTIPNKDNNNVTQNIKNALKRINGRIFVYFSPLFQSDNKDTILKQLEKVFEIGEIKSVQTYGNKLEFCELFARSDNEIDNAKLNNIITEESTEKLIQNQFYSNLQKTAIKFENNDRTTTKIGDTIAVTIACYENGEYINLGYSPKGTILRTITLGTGQVFSEIEESLIGQNVEDLVSVTYTFPEEYQNNSEIAGKTLELEILINAIQKELPEITDQLIMENFEFDSIEAYYDYLTKQLSK